LRRRIAPIKKERKRKRKKVRKLEKIFDITDRKDKWPGDFYLTKE
jgi:hypothetical protein